MVNISIPENYTVESSPEPLILKLPENLGSFQLSNKILGNKIQLSASVELNKALMGPETYVYLKEFFNQMINKQKEQVVLTKVK